MEQLHLKISLLRALPLFFAGLFLIACDHNVKKRGYMYTDDMIASDAYETYAPNSNFPDGKTSQPSVDGTIPREMIPYHYEKTPEGMVKAGKELPNPFTVNKENLERGKKMFTIYCAVCHGATGDGKGLLFESGKYPTEPASLISEDLFEKPQGEIYHVITVGSAIMGPHASQIRSQDRWKIIMYIREGLQKNEKDRLAMESNTGNENNKKIGKESVKK